MSTSESSYHHGALRYALIEAGLASLDIDNNGDISLRALARSVGVSPAAVYRHFPNKQALLDALASEGLNQLGTAQEAARDNAGGQREGFAEMGREYVRFALARPALFRLMFAQGEPTRASSGTPDPARDLLYHATRSLTRDEGEAERLALQAWAIAHGVAMLMLDGRLPGDRGLIDRLLDTETLFPPQGRRSEESP